MRILYVVKNMRLSNGVTSYVMNYYRKLHGRDNIQIDFLVVNDVGSPYYEEIEKEKSKIFLMPSYKTKFVKIVPYLNNIFKKNKYDILHCNVVNSGSLILMLAKKNDIKIRILHSHATQVGDSVVKRIRNKFFTAISLYYATNYFACSDLAGKGLFGNKKYEIVHNAIDINKYRFNSTIRNKYRKENHCEDKLIIITVGRFTKQKNPYFIVKIIKELSKQEKNFELWWFGNGELEDEIKIYAQKNNLIPFIKFWGASDKVNEYYSAADIFILPSLFEGLPVVGIEAQVSGLPILFSDRITKEAKISKYVEFLDINNPIDWVNSINKMKLINRKDIIAKINLEQYEIKEQARKLETLYQNLLEKK